MSVEFRVAENRSEPIPVSDTELPSENHTDSDKENDVEVETAKLGSLKVKEIICTHILNFLIIGVITLSATIYTNRQIALEGREFQANLFKRQNQEATFHQVSELLNRRLYRMRVLIRHYQDPQYTSDTAILRGEYRAAIDDWNSSLATNVRSIRMRFGEASEKRFKEIHEEFRTLHRLFAKEVLAYQKQSQPPSALSTNKSHKPRFLENLSQLDEVSLQKLSSKIDELDDEMLTLMTNH